MLNLIGLKWLSNWLQRRISLCKKEKKTYEEKLKIYKKTGKKKVTYEQTIETLMKYKNCLIAEKTCWIRFNKCNNVLINIALRPNSLNMVENIDLVFS